jgi:hypothetical protein
MISCTKSKKFDSHQWKYSHEGLGHFYPHREAMLQDLTKGEYLKHLHKNEIIKILGKPDDSKNKLMYQISVEWCNSLAPEPVYVKNLIVLLNNKLIFKDFKIEEWKD